MMVAAVSGPFNRTSVVLGCVAYPALWIMTAPYPGPWDDGAVPDLVLGTAQWGAAYGITNTSGRVSDADLRVIVAEAERVGVTTIDTAISYGEAQLRMAPFAEQFWVSTKVSGVGDVAEQVGLCLEQLQITSLDAVMLHDWETLEESERSSAVTVLRDLASEGVIERVGVSAYGAPGIESALEAFSDLGATVGIVQVPASAIDRRLDSCAVLGLLNSQGCVVQVRSVFLQGLLAGVGGGRLGSHADVHAYRDWASRQPGGAIGAALAHVKALPWASQVVVGATSAVEWAEVCAAWCDTQPRCAPITLASRDEALLDPRRWA